MAGGKTKPIKTIKMEEKRIVIKQIEMAHYRVDREFNVDDPFNSKFGYNIRDMPNRWFEIDYEELGEGYVLKLTSNMNDPVRPWKNFGIAKNLKEANRKNYEKAKKLAKETLRIFPEGRIVDLISS